MTAAMTSNEVKPVVEKTKTENGTENGENEDENCPDGLCVLKEDRSPVQPLDYKPKWVSPPKDIFKPFLEAVEEFNMVKNGDRVLVCLSGTMTTSP